MSTHLILTLLSRKLSQHNSIGIIHILFDFKIGKYKILFLIMVTNIKRELYSVSYKYLIVFFISKK